MNLIEARIGDNGFPEVSIAAFQLEKPFDFGRFIADVARHGAKAFATTYSMDEDEAMQQICEGLTEQLRWQDSSIEMINPGSLDS
ncbi:DUF5076 domain-containing protein [Pontixanthobacter aquaemixtae]|uniref:DUF5076 domain-containing protein n=1 Tax=Pontixanthobacter aquaemixtae TaxID=1958940 RepID=A0A844ZY08_9SPHN|nr:DUF5076 domain-containing protein [Pontixanthobacter aquaemixtae]MXO91637.1 DUF5076 domain-containing protein [Pontixanthobacter aquaemixtae]